MKNPPLRSPRLCVTFRVEFNADGRIDIADFGQFSVRFFTTLP